MLNSTRTTSTPTAPSIPTFTPHSVDSSTPSSSGGLNTLRRIKRALERQESKSRSGLYPDLATKENIDGSARPESSCSIESGRYKKKSLQIKTNLGETESAVASCRQTSFDLNSLLNSKPNEYTRALQRIESIKRTAFSVTGNSQAFPAIKSCRVNTCEARIEDPCEVYNALAPKSVPSKKQITVEPVKVQEEEPVKVQTSGFSTVKEGTPEKESEEAKYKEKIAKLSKENRELKRKLNKQEQEHNAKLEEIKAKYENEIEELKNEIEKRVLENNQESEIVIETTKGQLDDEIARNEILRRQIIDLEANASELKDNLQKTQDEKAEIMKEIEQLKETYEARISEIQESHIEGELASASEINALKQQLEAMKSQNKEKILEIDDYIGSETDIIDDDQNNSAILEESSVKVKSIHRTENLFEKKNRAMVPMSDRLRSIVTQIEGFIEEHPDSDEDYM